ncbi:MAG: glycosyltransferase family 39 protein [Treponema sp.]|nr:glycosyltransferase family 39 protein [Treponema sp.]
MPSETFFKTSRGLYLALFCIALGVALSSSYMPFNFRIMYVDSSVYLTVTQGISRGLLPYRDLVDNKGPLTYLISLPGYSLGGFTGVWLTEILVLFVSVFFAYKTALFFAKPKEAFLAVLFSFVALMAFMLVNAGTEQYSLPFLMISVYFFSRHFFSGEPAGFWHALILGLCFAAAILIRLNMFPLWVGFCLVIFIVNVYNKSWARLSALVLGFILGAALVALPVFLYLSLNGIWDDFYAQVIVAGASRGFGTGDLKEIEKTFFTVLGRNNSAIPLYLGIFWVLTGLKRHELPYYVGFSISYFLMVLFLSFSSGGVHYNLVLIPFFVPMLSWLITILGPHFARFKRPTLVLIFFMSCLFVPGIIRYGYYITHFIHDRSGANLKVAGRLIDEHTGPGDTIISLGINGYIYPFTRLMPASRYIYQGSGLNHLSGARDEFIHDILSRPPAIITTVTEGGRREISGHWHGPIMEMVGRDYRLLSDQYGHDIYIRKDVGP